MKLRALDMFAGIGGFSLGLERTGGFETVGFVEIDPFCRRVLAKHWPGVPCHDDVTTRDYEEGEADVITAGFPCQDISLAGRGAGFAGSRSGLFREVVRALRLVRPAYALLENVAALLGRGLDTVLGALAEVGYDAEWHCIPASAVGAPHRRDRIWIVAYPGSEQYQGHSTPLSGKIAAELSRTAADANGQREHVGAVDAEVESASKPVADAARHGRVARRARDASQDSLAYADEPGLEVIVNGQAGECSPTFGSGGQWSSEPDVGRVAHGIPSRVDRLRSLGNAVVPQIPEVLGRAILLSRSEAA